MHKHGSKLPRKKTAFRTTLTLPADLATGLNRVAKKMGVSQSALVTSLLSEAVPDLERLLLLAPKAQTDADGIKRFRGASIDAINAAVQKALKRI